MAEGFTKNPDLFDYKAAEDQGFHSSQDNGIDRGDAALLGFKTLLTALDIAQTRHIARNPQQYDERSSAWAIGSHPSPNKATAYLLGQLAVSALAAKYLPDPYKKGFLALSVGDQLKSVYNNTKIKSDSTGQDIGIGLH